LPDANDAEEVFFETSVAGADFGLMCVECDKSIHGENAGDDHQGAPVTRRRQLLFRRVIDYEQTLGQIFRRIDDGNRSQIRAILHLLAYTMAVVVKNVPITVS
jgi:hypothetical protein